MLLLQLVFDVADGFSVLRGVKPDVTFHVSLQDVNVGDRRDFGQSVLHVEGNTKAPKDFIFSSFHPVGKDETKSGAAYFDDFPGR